MHSELVERRRWISEQRFLHALNYCMLWPGPAAQKHYGPALIDDHTPTPLHARCSRARLAAVLGTSLMLWLMAMGWFFTKAALLTFGGAYAVLPYVYQGAVDQHHWLSAAQMIGRPGLG